MNHPYEDRLLLLAYGDLPAAEAAEVEAHVASCATCGAAFEQLERARVALDWAVPERRRPVPWIAVGLAAAAVLAAVFFTRLGSRGPEPWQPVHVWSPTAGYIAGGQPLVEIDAQLTRLEQERTYARP
ncbi:MAG TPA: zf-HC2 domain-containing protein [Gemmatimonadales bacterium]|jgi:anti-sigma factor RsiW|nr:zf-HC2 domain-containing protein [Gemmatimonadales bacterium]